MLTKCLSKFSKLFLTAIIFFVPIPSVLAQGPMDYDDCVQYALEHSPYLTKSEMEIDIRRLDESDARWSFVPHLYLKSSYALGNYRRSGNDDLRDWSVSFSTGNYNPLETYFTLEVRKYLTQIAVVAHKMAISQGEFRLAQGFLRMEAMSRQEIFMKEIESLALENLEFVRKRHELDAVPFLEVQVAAQRMAVIQSKGQKLSALKKKVRKDFKEFLGFPPQDELELDLKDVRQQVLDDFDPSSAGIEQAKARSHILKIQDIKEKLQDWRITLAYTEYIPKFSFGVKTPDLAENELEGSDYYVALNANLPLWQGFKRPRNIRRQKKILRQFKSDTVIKERELAAEWRDVVQKNREAEIDLKLAKSSEDLALLELKATRIGYNSNKKSYGDVLSRRMNYIYAQENRSSKETDRDLALLELRHLCENLYEDRADVDPRKEN